MLKLETFGDVTNMHKWPINLQLLEAPRNNLAGLAFRLEDLMGLFCAKSIFSRRFAVEQVADESRLLSFQLSNFTSFLRDLLMMKIYYYTNNTNQQFLMVP